MIKIEKLDMANKIDMASCNACHTRNYTGMLDIYGELPVEDIYQLLFSVESGTSYSAVRLCKKHLLELRDLIDKEIAK